MKRILDQLTPSERRFAVGMGVVVFIFINYWYVWSHFGDLKRDEGRMEGAKRTLETYKKELKHTNDYQLKIRALESGGGDVGSEEQALDFERYLRKRATESGVAAGIQGNSRPITHSNEFFIEQEMTLVIVTEEKNLVDFLASLGTSNSLVRVRSMELKPDPSHQQLNASLTILASYQRKTPAPVAAPVIARTDAKSTGKPLVELPKVGTAAPAPGPAGAKPPARTPNTPSGAATPRPRPGPGGQLPQNPPSGPPAGGKATNSGLQSLKFKSPPPKPSGTP